MIAIEIINLGKKYEISSTKDNFRTLRNKILNYLYPSNLYKRLFNHRKEVFWALKDVSLKIRRGEVLGIIGRNGAGKTTLLKILSKITPPTSGNVRIKGKVAALLEVGTGFHPELTGRENILFNGAILGMKRMEILKKFNDIVEFSGVENFLDTQVKHYSSGMSVRLAFSIAAHLDPDILLVDEVLAVGDFEFQKKCLGKMNEITKQNGRTIIFISHNLDAIQNLCKKCAWIDNGNVKMYDQTEKVINSYLSNINLSLHTPLAKRIDRIAGKRFRFIDYKIMGSDKYCDSLILNGESITFKFEYEAHENFNYLTAAIGVNDSMGNRIITLSSNFIGKTFNLDKGTGFLSISIKRLPVKPGKYFITLHASCFNEILDQIDDALCFDIMTNPDDFYKIFPTRAQGNMIAEFNWHNNL